ncbi:MAG TPA: exodeoxyribonuclease VII large subunit, partial [Longimicrobiaceae bacterium]|nr:exodeoxyribonuclease VII large subunit [Longimicrobiaceae bacterium]
FQHRLDLRDAARRMLRRKREGVAATAGRLHALSPLGALARGFALPHGPEGRLLRRAADFAPGGRFTLTVADGSVPCRVEEPAAAPAEA